MADYNSSLPVRTENAGDVISKIADATTPSQQLAVNADGSLNVTDNGGSLTVDGSVTVSATDLDIRNLSAAQDNVAISDGTDTLAVNADGSLNITDNGSSLTVDATDLDIRDLAFATDKVDVSGSSNVAVVDGGGSLTVDAVDLDIRDLAFATDKVDVTGSSVTVSATDLDIRDLTAATDSVSAWLKDEAGNAFSAANPLPVSISDDTEGVEINDYKTDAAVAGGASANHDYTVTALKTLLLKQVWASASGKMKVEVQIETGVATGVFVTKFVAFNSTANPNIEIPVKSVISVAAGVRVRVIRTNKDNQAQDLYSTITGNEI